jgi:methyl-accepting chemotaxis protein
MAFNPDRARRLEAMEIDDKTRAILREVAPHIEKSIDTVIDSAYRHILRYPDAAKAYHGVKVEDVVKAQRKHWLEDILPATFEEDQMQKSVRLFRERQKMGLELRWYYAFYGALLRGFIAAVVPQYKKRPERLVEVIDAINAVLLFDLELASSAFMNGSHEDAAGFIERSAGELQAKVADVAVGVESAAASVRAHSVEVSDEAKSTVAAVDKAASASDISYGNMEAAAAATEQLAASIQEIGRQAERSRGIVKDAVSEAGRANTMVADLAAAVSKIDEVVKLINNIAGQTNLLALNATIEAARAGDAGKGFAVVANEVKQLANQTGRATKEIAAQIAAVQNGTNGAVGVIKGIGETIGRISEISATIASAVEEQAAATGEISKNVQQAVDSGQVVQQAVATVRATAVANEKTSAALTGDAAALVSGVKELRREIDGLSGEVARFTDQTRR